MFLKVLQFLIIIEVLNSFKPELQLIDTESAIKSKLIDLLSELRGFN